MIKPSSDVSDDSISGSLSSSELGSSRKGSTNETACLERDKLLRKGEISSSTSDILGSENGLFITLFFILN